MRSPNLFDVIVVGSGPAGSTAARRLARDGMNVLIIEKARLPRYKTCGGGIVHRALEYLPTGIDGVTNDVCRQADLHVHDAGLEFHTSRAEPIVFMTMRSDFDSHLAFLACEAGAALKQEYEVIDVAQSDDNVRVATSQGTFQAKFLVAADGASGIVARKTGWEETRVLAPALEYEVYLKQGDAGPFHGRARFDLGLVPFGYGWVFPKNDHLSVGVLTTRPGSTNLNEDFHQYLDTVGLTEIGRMERHGFVVPVRPRTNGYARGRVMLVGDAAGFSDPVTAEGISFALQSGGLAAEAIVGANFDPRRAEHAYTEFLGQTILPEIRAGLLLQKLLYNPLARSWLFRKYGQTFSEAMTDVVTGRQSYRNILFSTENYAKLLKHLFMQRSAHADPALPG